PEPYTLSLHDALPIFDLSNPDAPVAKGTLWFSGSGNVIAATDTYLFVAVASPSDYWRSTVHCLDITAPDGTMNEVGAISTAGRVDRKSTRLNSSHDQI